MGRGPNWARAGLEEADQFWVLSTAYQFALSCGITPDKVFQLHGESLFEPWLHEVEEKVVLIAPHSDYPKAATVPVFELAKKYGPKFASSFVWMMAMALEAGFDEIIIHGVHLAHQSEYGIQRDSYFWFAGLAEAKGVKITVPTDSGLYLGDFLYGVEK